MCALSELYAAGADRLFLLHCGWVCGCAFLQPQVSSTTERMDSDADEQSLEDLSSSGQHGLNESKLVRILLDVKSHFLNFLFTSSYYFY